MNKQNIKYWMMATACLGMLTTVTGCKEDDFPDNAIPKVVADTPTEFSEQVLWPSNLARVSVHDLRFASGSCQVGKPDDVDDCQRSLGC